MKGTQKSNFELDHLNYIDVHKKPLFNSGPASLKIKLGLCGPVLEEVQLCQNVSVHTILLKFHDKILQQVSPLPECIIVGKLRKVEKDNNSEELQQFIIYVHRFLSFYYPMALKGCQAIVFTHGVWMGGCSGGWEEKFVRAVSQKP